VCKNLAIYTRVPKPTIFNRNNSFNFTVPNLPTLQANNLSLKFLKKVGDKKASKCRGVDFVSGFGSLSIVHSVLRQDSVLLFITELNLNAIIPLDKK